MPKTLGVKMPGEFLREKFNLDFRTLLKIAILISIPLLGPFVFSRLGMNPKQTLALSIFLVSITGTLFFWEIRLGITFIGVSVLLMADVLSIQEMVLFASVDVIFFLIGMMIIVQTLQDEGVFAWLLSRFIVMRNFSAVKFVFSLCILSALCSCLLDEITAILLMTALVLEVCDFYEIDPIPYIIMTVMATNVGSAATVLGNPIGIIIASKSGLTFEDFLRVALPLSFLALLTLVGVFIVYLRKDNAKFDKSIRVYGNDTFLNRLLNVPMEPQLKRALFMFCAVVALIALHHRIEVLLGLGKNTVLVAMPLIVAGLIMISNRKRAKKHLTEDVDWWTLLFFMFLFAQAGTLKHTGATDVLANAYVGFTGQSHFGMVSTVLWMSTFCSGFLDNVVWVVSMIPVVTSLKALPLYSDKLWWALLLGGCLGGNLTMIGSTANIVAMGVLEKKGKVSIRFSRWLKIGIVVTMVTTIIAWIGLMLWP